MVKKMRKMTGRLVDLVTGKRFLTMAGLALVSNALALCFNEHDRLALGDAVADGATVADRAGGGRDFCSGHRCRRHGAGLWRRTI